MYGAVYTGRECKIATAQVHKFPHMGKFMHLIRKDIRPTHCTKLQFDRAGLSAISNAKSTFHAKSDRHRNSDLSRIEHIVKLEIAAFIVIKHKDI